MPQKDVKMKLVAVRMLPKLHSAALRMARREKIGFGEFVRRSVDGRIVLFKMFPDALKIKGDRLPADGEPTRPISMRSLERARKQVRNRK